MTDLVDTVLEEMGQLPLWAVLATVCAVMALETTMLVGVVVPGDIVVLFAASSDRGLPELVLLVVAVTVGSLTGETVGYGLGQRWGQRLRTSRAGRALGEERWDRAAGFLHDRGGRAVFLARYLAAVHAVTPIVAGTVGMRYRRFIAWCALGGLSWSVLYVVVGAVAGASYRRYADSLGTATSVAVGGLIGVAVFLAALAVRDREVVRVVAGMLARLARFPRPARLARLPRPARLPRLHRLARPDRFGRRSPPGGGERRCGPLVGLALTVVAFGACILIDVPAAPAVLAVAAAAHRAARAGRITPALAAGGLVTGSGIAFRWLVEGDSPWDVEIVLGGLLLLTVALIGDATRSSLTRTPQVWVPSITCVDVRQRATTDNQQPVDGTRLDDGQWAEASRC